jgi:signal transduction histidine kinase
MTEVPAERPDLGVRMEDLADAGIHLDQSEANAERWSRRRRTHTRVYPLLRLIGFELLLAGVVAHNVLILGNLNGPAVLTFAIVANLYCLVSWVVLIKAYGRFKIIGRITLGDVFFALDMVLWTFAIYVSGADRSWLFFILLMRVGDNVHAGVKTAFTYAHLAVFCYLGLLLYLADVEHRPIDWRAGAAKLMFLYISGMYLALAAGPAAKLRRKTGRAIALAGDLIAKLDESALQLRKEKQAAETARRDAVRANEFKSVMLSRVSHEFRTPLNHILGFSQILEMDEMSAAQRESVEQISIAGHRLLSLVDEVLDISASETGELDLHIEPLHFVPLIESVLEQLHPEAAMHDVTIKMYGVYDLASSVSADKTRLLQVLSNLVSNAVKYNRPGGEVHIIAEETVTRRLRISVRDTGPGIPLDRVESLFIPFERLGNDHASGGKGLGLVLSKALVIAMQGTIEVRSEPGHGSTFTIDLPLSESALSA